jgi:hypothetical protein
VTTLWGCRSEFRIPAGTRDFSLPRNIPTGPGTPSPPLSLLFSGYRRYFRGQSDRNVKFTFTFTFTLRLFLHDVDRDNFTFFFNESRCQFISNALFYIGPGFKSRFGVRFNLRKDISGFSQSHQGRCRFHRYSFLAVIYCTCFFYGSHLKARLDEDSRRLQSDTSSLFPV